MILLAEEVSDLWKIPNFLILAGFLGFMIKKHGSAFIQSRSTQIRESLEAGEKAKREADARAAEVEKRIAGLDREIAELRSASRADLEREADRIRREGDAEVQRIERHTSLEIVSIGKQAREELRQYAVSLAIDLAEKNIRGRMSPDVQAGLVHNFEGDLDRVGGSRQ